MDPIDAAVAFTIAISGLGLAGSRLVVARALPKRSSQPQRLAGGAELHELRHAIDQLGAELTDLQERVDFTERVLASQREPQRIKGAT